MSDQRVAYSWYDLAVLAESYITPNDPSVQAWVQQVIAELQAQGKDTPRERMVAAFDKVAVDVRYWTDEAIYGKVEYWQMPAETITLKTANCEDSAFLLASMLKAMGVTTRVNFGTWSGQGHAWVEAYADGWGGYLETTLETPFTGFADPSGYILESYTSWSGEPIFPLTDPVQRFTAMLMPGIGLFAVGAFLMVDDAHDFGLFESTYPPRVDISWIAPASMTGPHSPWPHHWLIGLLLMVIGIALMALALAYLIIAVLDL